ncbi:MAG: hypothetical protein ACREBS_11070 [Nitrososphaerales archaeon]
MALTAPTATRVEREERQSLSETDPLARAIDIYAILSNRDSFDIFCLASSGIHATTRILAEYKFSKKRYYVRLKELIETGLVQKEGRFYRHTTLGTIVYENQVKGLLQSLSKQT